MRRRRVVGGSLGRRGMAEPGDRQLVGTWLRLSDQGDLLGAGSDRFFDGVAPYDTRDYWRIGSPWRGMSCATNRLLVGEAARDLLRPFGVGFLQMERMIVVDPGLRWEEWSERSSPIEPGTGRAHTDCSRSTTSRRRARGSSGPRRSGILRCGRCSVTRRRRSTVWTIRASGTRSMTTATASCCANRSGARSRRGMRRRAAGD